jgi:hypothetical protein
LSFIVFIGLLLKKAGKGIVGWKAPPKPVRKEPVRQPTQTQSDAAKRLSQGLSVSAASHRESSVRHRNNNVASNLFYSSSANKYVFLCYFMHFYCSKYNYFSGNNYLPHGVVLDPHELTGPNLANIQMSPNNMVQIDILNNNSAQIQQNWPSTKSSKYFYLSYIHLIVVIIENKKRLIEESRMNRMRLEAVRQANNAAVLRQQVFHFDPNYYPYFNSNASDNSSVGGGSVSEINGNTVNGTFIHGMANGVPTSKQFSKINRSSLMLLNV